MNPEKGQNRGDDAEKRVDMPVHPLKRDSEKGHRRERIVSVDVIRDRLVPPDRIVDTHPALREFSVLVSGQSLQSANQTHHHQKDYGGGEHTTVDASVFQDVPDPGATGRKCYENGDLVMPA